MSTQSRQVNSADRGSLLYCHKLNRIKSGHPPSGGVEEKANHASKRRVLLSIEDGGHDVVWKASVPPMNSTLPTPVHMEWLLTVWLLSALVGPEASADISQCLPVRVGVDSTQSDNCLPVYLGSAWGQVFEARDTLLLAISVWREPKANSTPLRIHIMELDSTGTPDFQRILRRGPTLQTDEGDGVHPVRFRFEFDPPVALPGPGHYEFAVQVAPDPVCDGATCLLGSTLDPFAEGGAWEHPRNYPLPDCPLLSAHQFDPAVDLCFEAEFCDAPTAAIRYSWGRLKVRYR